MSEAGRIMTAEAFLDWCLGQEGRWELVDGVPVAMAGAKQVHDRVVVNALLALGGQLRGGPCRPTTGDVAIGIPNGNIRRPDLGVDCGRFEPESLTATDPRLVIEVLSPSTRTFDAIGKLWDYRQVPGPTFCRRGWTP
jgi:Uma2 family endonuclease